VFVSSRLDYCNSLLYGVNDSLLKKLQIVHNAAARVVTGVRKFDHISPVLHELHWLPVRHRITHKLATIVYKCLHRLAPSYLDDDCMPVTTVAGRRHLRSADSRCLVVSRTKTVLSTCNFAVAGPHGTAPQYLSDQLSRVADMPYRSRLWSSISKPTNCPTIASCHSWRMIICFCWPNAVEHSFR